MNNCHFKFVFGAMGCGKTARLRGDYFSKVGDNFEAIIVKPKIDTKGDRCIETRDGSKLEATFVLNKEDNIYQLVTEYLFLNTLDFIFVDEIEFLTEEQIIQLAKIVDKLGINVIGYGIITDFLGNMFPGAVHTMEWADQFEYLERQCSCGNLKIRNMRLENGIPVFDGEQISIDGVDSTYEPVCRNCYEREKNKAKKRILKMKSNSKCL